MHAQGHGAPDPLLHEVPRLLIRKCAAVARKIVTAAVRQLVSTPAMAGEEAVPGERAGGARGPGHACAQAASCSARITAVLGHASSAASSSACITLVVGDV